MCESVLYTGYTARQAIEKVGEVQFPDAFLNERVGLTEAALAALDSAGLKKHVKPPQKKKPVWTVSEKAALFLMSGSDGLLEAIQRYGDEVMLKVAREEHVTVRFFLRAKGSLRVCGSPRSWSTGTSARSGLRGR